MTNPILSVEDLSKTYITFKKEPGLLAGVKSLFHREKILVHAARDLNFVIAKGEFVGLLGPNGAGKTTTLKMLTGLIRPSSGKATAFGQYDTAKRNPDYLRRIGMVMGQRNQLNPDLPAMDSFQLAQAIYGITDTNFTRRLNECVKLFAIEDKLLTPVRKLSLGERMKLELILAILHEPEVLYLDEPTIGLDFNAARQIRNFLAEANKKLGITVILTSHYTKDIEELCRRVILINHGKIVYDGRLAGMDDRLKGQKIVSLFFRSQDASNRGLELVKSAGDGSVNHIEKESAVGTFELQFDVSVQHAATFIRKIVSAFSDDDVIDIKVSERPIDDIFSEIYSKPETAT